MPPWILPARFRKTALAYASRVAFSSGGITYSPGRSSPSSAGLALPSLGKVDVCASLPLLRLLLGPAFCRVLAEARQDDATTDPTNRPVSR
eukprot:3621073-Prymnesium_polylepis.1